jgi:catechol 2,3-dioxygenase-like lactoylglutathione lyase family enzyme
MAGSNIGAVGIGVSDLDRSTDFYTRVLGMTETQRFKLPHMDEVIVGFDSRMIIALMHWTDGSTQHYRGNPVKLVFYVSDAKAVMAAIRAEGLPVTREPAPLPGFGDMLIGLAEDPDGYVIELLQQPG